MRQRPGLILVPGFGGLLLLMAAAEVASLLLLNSLRQSDAQRHARFLAQSGSRSNPLQNLPGGRHVSAPRWRPKPPAREHSSPP